VATRSLVAAFAAVVLVLAEPAVARTPPTGFLVQLQEPLGCVASVRHCTDAGPLYTPSVPAMSPDGRNVYVAGGNGVAAFARNAATGALRFVELDARCEDSYVCGEPQVVAVAPDGTHVYVATIKFAEGDFFDYAVRGEVVAFARDSTTGALTQVPGGGGCVRSDVSGGCATVPALVEPTSLAFSPDGTSLYVGSGGVSAFSALVAFARDAASGALRQLPGTAGCMRTYERVPLHPACTAVREPFERPRPAVSPDGKQLYLAVCGSAGEIESGPECDAGGLAIFARDGSTGALRQLPGTSRCLSAQWRGCASARAIAAATDAYIPPDGAHVYVVSSFCTLLAECGFGRYPGLVTSGSIAIFRRDRATGALTQLPGKSGCVVVGRVAEDEVRIPFLGRRLPNAHFGHPTCAASPRGIASSDAIGASRDGSTIYVSASLDVAGLAIFTRDHSTGRLRQLRGSYGCVKRRRSRRCAGAGLPDGPSAVVVSSDGLNAYIGGYSRLGVFRVVGSA
jgi:DNA-binding beta-propeller fold protein YncE